MSSDCSSQEDVGDGALEGATLLGGGGEASLDPGWLSGVSVAGKGSTEREARLLATMPVSMSMRSWTGWGEGGAGGAGAISVWDGSGGDGGGCGLTALAVGSTIVNAIKQNRREPFAGS